MKTWLCLAALLAALAGGCASAPPAHRSGPPQGPSGGPKPFDDTALRNSDSSSRQWNDGVGKTLETSKVGPFAPPKK